MTNAVVARACTVRTRERSPSYGRPLAGNFEGLRKCALTGPRDNGRLPGPPGWLAQNDGCR